MAEPGNSVIRSLLQKSFIRIPLKLALWLIVFVVIAFAGVVAYNALDDDLSADAMAMLALQPMSAIDDKSGFIAFLGMIAPTGQDQMAWGRKAAAAYTAQAQPGFAETPEWKEATKSHIKIPETRKLWCMPEARDCLAEAKRDSAAVAARTLAEGDNALLLARYRKARDEATFTDLYIGTNPAASIPGYSALTAGALLSIADNAVKLHAGDFETVVAELEREVAFHRRIIMGGHHSIIAAMVGNRLLSRDLLIISELLRSDGERVAPFRVRLGALTRPQSSAAALESAFRYEAHTWVTLGRNIRAILRDNRGWMLGDNFGSNLSPLVHWAQSLLTRPNETANMIAALAKIDASIAGAPAAQFDAKVKEIQVAKAVLWEWPWYSRLRNPVGRDMFADPPDLGSYAARMHDLQALERMTDLQITLATRDITDPVAMAIYIAGEGAQSHADPYTGKAFTFDPEKRLLSFEPRAKGGWGGDLKKRYGKAGIAF